LQLDLGYDGVGASFDEARRARRSGERLAVGREEWREVLSGS
jgi:hypothetical protein